MGEVILALQRGRRTIIAMLLFSACLTTLIYLISIRPIFGKMDFTNSEVVEFVLSDNFQKNTQPVFAELRAYNAGLRSSAPSDIHVGSGAQGALAVVIHYRLEERSPTEAELQLSGLPSKLYAYKPEIDIQLVNRPLLITATFLLVELCLLGYTLFTPPGLEERYVRPALDDYLLPPAADPEPPPLDAAPAVDATAALVVEVAALLRRFDLFARELQVRRAPRAAMTFEDEYDVQDALRPMLRLHYDDVLLEEPNPSFAGGWSRGDFLLKDHGVIIEAKMTRVGLKDAELGAQLLVAIGRYQANADCKHLVFLVYDPKRLLKNPAVIKKDFEDQRWAIPVTVVISPTP